MVRNNDTDPQQALIQAPQQVTQRTVAALERQVDDYMAAKPATVAISMSNVQIIDSFGLNWLINAQSRLQTVGSQVVIQDPTALVQDIFTATRLDSRFRLAYSAAEGGVRNA